jgi:hypothetical protein
MRAPTEETSPRQAPKSKESSQKPRSLTRIAAEKRFVVHADEKLTAFVELQRAIHEFAVGFIS